MHKRILGKMYKRCMVAVMALIMLFTMTGCSLAVKDAEEESGMERKDRLVGMFITRKHVDLSKRNTENDEDANRVYATINYNDSTRPEEWNVDFDGIEGYAFFNAEFQTSDEPFFAMIGAEEVCDVNQHLNSSDEIESILLSGNLYIVKANDREGIFYTNPVYQKESGEIYFTPGQGAQVSSDGTLKIKLEEEITWERDGKTRGYSGAVEVSFEVLDCLPANIQFHFMNDQLDILHTESYEAGAVPEELNAVEGAVCVVVETVWADGTVTRELLEREEDERVVARTFYLVDNYILAKKDTLLIWK